MKTFNIIKEQLQYNRLMQPNTKKQLVESRTKTKEKSNQANKDFES